MSEVPIGFADEDELNELAEQAQLLVDELRIQGHGIAANYAEAQLVRPVEKMLTARRSARAGGHEVACGRLSEGNPGCIDYGIVSWCTCGWESRSKAGRGASADSPALRGALHLRTHGGVWHPTKRPNGPLSGQDDDRPRSARIDPARVHNPCQPKPGQTLVLISLVAAISSTGRGLPLAVGFSRGLRALA